MIYTYLGSQVDSLILLWRVLLYEPGYGDWRDGSVVVLYCIAGSERNLNLLCLLAFVWVTIKARSLILFVSRSWIVASVASCSILGSDTRIWLTESFCHLNVLLLSDAILWCPAERCGLVLSDLCLVFLKWYNYTGMSDSMLAWVGCEHSVILIRSWSCRATSSYQLIRAHLQVWWWFVMHVSVAPQRAQVLVLDPCQCSGWMGSKLLYKSEFVDHFA